MNIWKEPIAFKAINIAEIFYSEILNCTKKPHPLQFHVIYMKVLIGNAEFPLWRLQQKYIKFKYQS